MKDTILTHYITDPSGIKSTKHYNFLSMLYLTIMLIMVSVCSYMVEIHGFIFNEGAAMVTLLYFLQNVISEVYGYHYARSLIWKALSCEAIFVLTIILMVHLPSPLNWLQQGEYRNIFGSFYKILIVNLLFFPIGEFANIFLLAKLKILLRGRLFWVRNICASFAGEIILAVLGNIIVFWGNNNRAFTTRYYVSIIHH